MDLEKYKSNAKAASLKGDLPLPMPLYEKIQQGNVDFLVEAFNLRKAILLEQIRKGSNRENFVRWQACIEALEAACQFLSQYKSN